MRRGETVTAMFHAVEAQEKTLTCDILEHAGGVRMIMRQDIGQLVFADQLLDESLLSQRPRLNLFRCLTSALSGRLAEARERYAAVSAMLPAPAKDENEGNFDLSVDDCIVRCDIALHGAARIGSEWTRDMRSDLLRFAKSPRLDPSTRGHLQYRLGIAYQLAGQFDAALDHVSRAQRHLVDDRRMNVFIELEMGQIAMVQGRAADAEKHYGQAQETIRAQRVPDPMSVMVFRILWRELRWSATGSGRLRNRFGRQEG